MVVIRKLEDVRAVVRFPKSVRGWLEDLFHKIAATCGGDDAWKHFSLEDANPIVFLEDAADCADLSPVGLHVPYCGTFPELVERCTLADASGETVTLYVATVVRSNSEVVTICSVVGSLDAATEAFLKGNAMDG